MFLANVIDERGCSIEVVVVVVVLLEDLPVIIGKEGEVTHLHRLHQVVAAKAVGVPPLCQ